MSIVMIIIDGMTDHPCASLGGLTPFEFADCKNMAFMKKNGSYGELNVRPNGFAVESLPCILTLLGVPPEKIPTGRAYFEALSAGISVDETDLVLRCNLVRIKDGKLISSCCEGLSEQDFADAAKRFSALFDNEMAFYHMSSYKNLLVIKNAADRLHTLSVYAPHEHIGTIFEMLYPRDAIIGNQLKSFIHKSIEVLNSDMDSDIRYAFLPWGQSRKQEIPTFCNLHGLSSASVCATEIVRGLCKAMDMRVIDLEGATSDTDTNLTNKAAAVLQQIGQTDFILLHINGTDEAAHRKDPMGKAAFLKKIDEEVIASLIEKCPYDTSIMICSDHSTLSETGEHMADPQPFTIYRKNSAPKGYLGTFLGIEAIQILTNK